MKHILATLCAASLLLYLACTPKTGKSVAETPNPPLEPVMYDTIGKPEMGEDVPEIVFDFDEPAAINPDSVIPYNPAHTFEVDLIHTKLEISFDWPKKRANGKSTLTMKPWFYPTDRVTLDAKNFDIHSVTFDGKTEPLKYDYNNEQITIALGRSYTRNEEFKVTITYTAKPDERESYGGSNAITSDKGLYFINPDGSDKEKPMQIWTQGETESNSFWMPTVDKPNERCTQEMYITVADKFKTLSNGLLISSKKNTDGTRTDYWKMDKPHAPYLFMMAIGEFAVVKDKWRNIDVDYYVEPKFEKDARAIFPHTPEMIEFFSNKLNYPYPWQKYAQVVVRDYVSGAMENTSAVIFGEFMQKTTEELKVDNEINEKVTAHELFHHWFGDLVTTESWANLTLNEGFANYSEYLWFEQKHGRDKADEHLMNEQMGYLLSAADGGHPLIHYGYNNREDMFDAHSYNKGGCVLHMLRNLVGDEAFFTSLNRYLKKHEYTEVEVDELRMAFEEVTGQDLNWFFNQWFVGAGHPVLEISYGWDEIAKKAAVTITQSQEGKDVTRVFNLPLAVDIYDEAGKVTRQNIQVVKRSQTFFFDAPSKPALINVDADKMLLSAKTDYHTAEEWAFQYRHAPRFRDRWDALENLQATDIDLASALAKDAIKDPYGPIRMKALTVIDPSDPDVLAAVEKMAENDPDNKVRSMCIEHLATKNDARYQAIFEKGVSPDQPLNIIGPSLQGLMALDPQAAIKVAKGLESSESGQIIEVLTQLYAQSPDLSYLGYFEKHINQIDGFPAFPFFSNFAKYLVNLNDPATFDNGIVKLKTIAMNLEGTIFRRFSAAKAVSDIAKTLQAQGDATRAESILKIFEAIKSNETDPDLKNYYEQF
ncbi:MAG: alanyl aminopeptidase [Saprospiraceae bacterium]|nr:alanyl aminopeptidase [Saprospiraceae bacterium]